MTTALLVRQHALGTTRLLRSDDRPLADGKVRLRIDHFALTANNITDAAFGDAMAYGGFFPTSDAGWGQVPVCTGGPEAIRAAYLDVLAGRSQPRVGPMLSMFAQSPAANGPR